MANDDDKKPRRRKGSYFPAVTQSFGLGYQRLDPQDNPAYQAAIRRPRSNLETIQLPDGGTARVPESSAQRTAGAVSGAYVTPTGPLSDAQYQAAYARGYGAPAPSINPATGTLTAGGIETPVESLTPQQRIGYAGANPLAELFQSRHSILGAIGTLGYNALSSLGVGRFFPPSIVDPKSSSLGGLGRMFGPAAGYFPNTPPTPTQNYSFPRPRFASETGDLLHDIDGTFYGGGHANPTPTPTPIVQPRRYFDDPYA